ncbi:MAG: DUF2277 domain-containing protein [Bacteroidota bacterium]
MCRSIKQLRNAEIPATDEEIHAAALQFVRKVSGYRKPSKSNEDAFEKAVNDVAEVTRRLLGELKQTHFPASSIQVEAITGTDPPVNL